MENRDISLLPGACSRGGALRALLKPITIFVGHFGSGKTEIAVNLAFGLRNLGQEVTLVDLDLVKPYFRCRLAKDDLSARGIRLVAPEGDRFYADLPILLPEARGALQADLDERHRMIFDVGGDDLGARVLGSISGLLSPGGADMLFVINTNRPFAEDHKAILAMFNEVETAARTPITGLVANTHLMEQTTRETVMEGVRASRKMERATGIPVRFCAILSGLADAFGGPEGKVDNLPVLAMERHIVAPFAAKPLGARRRSSVV